MTEAVASQDHARLLDFFRPGTLYEKIPLRPTFVLPTVILVICVVLYAQLAVGPAIPRVIPKLLEQSLATESELTRTFRQFIFAISLALPLVFVLLTAFATWVLSKIARNGFPFADVLSLSAYSFLWIAAGFAVKALLVNLTGEAEPATDLSFFFSPAGKTARVILAFTNPFTLLALLWTVRGLRAWGASRGAALLGGALPWASWIVILSVAVGGTRNFAPSGPLSYDDWKQIEVGTISLRHPPGLESEASDLATILDGFTRKLSRQFAFEPRPIRVFAHPDHRRLEQATGEFLHVNVTGSIRGRDLLYVEMPGFSAARSREEGLREAMRYAALMQLALVVTNAPRWFVEGVAHAATHPYSRRLELEYRSVLRKTGVPSYQDLLEERLFATPEGPILARSIVDFLAFHHGRDVPAAIQKDLTAGDSFRDALYAHTRLTTSALELGWQESIRALLEGNGDAGDPSDSEEPDSASVADDAIRPFQGLR